MAKMTAAKFAENCRSYIGRPYSEIDCSKLLYLASGKAIARGSNTQWRTETGKKGRITDGRPSDPYPAGNDRSSKQLEIGMAVFMHKSQDTKKYPDGLGDYCHVGVVTSVKPLRITNASAEKGEVCDYTRVGTFCAWAYLKDIDYGKETTEKTETTAKEEEAVNMLGYAYKLRVKASRLLIREQATTSSAKMGSFKMGDVAYAISKEGKWYKLANMAGYIHGDYVKVLEEVDDYTETTTEVDPETGAGMAGYVTMEFLRQVC